LTDGPRHKLTWPGELSSNSNIATPVNGEVSVIYLLTYGINLLVINILFLSKNYENDDS